MWIAGLTTYPMKAARRRDQDEVLVEPWGLAGDRRWLAVDDGAVGLTQRKVPRLATLRPQPYEGGLVLRAPGMPDLDVPEPADGEVLPVRVFTHKQPTPCRVAADAGGWISEFLGRPARLVWQADPRERPIESPAARDGDRLSLADGFPVLLAVTASLDAVNDWLAEAGAEPVPMTRFRPNIVIRGAEPWAEDGWVGRRLRFGDVVFRVAKACARCVVTTTDQETGEVGREPLRTLGRHRRFDDGLLFAVNLVPERTGFLRLGDEMHIQS